MKKRFVNLNKTIEFIGGAGTRRIMTYASSGAYYLFMSLVPMIMLICSIIQFTPLTQEMIMSAMDEYIPESLYRIMEQIVSTVFVGGRTALTISALLTIWSASNSMKALMRGMDSVYNVRRKENYLLFSLRACLYMVIFLVCILLALVIQVYGGKILELIRTYLPYSEAIDYLLDLAHYLRFAVTLAVLTLVFMVLYRWMPSAQMKYRHQWAGAVFTAVSWSVFSWIFSLYLGISDKFGAYGLIGTVMVAMMWMNYCLFFLLFGGYINCYLDSRRVVIPKAPHKPPKTEKHA